MKHFLFLTFALFIAACDNSATTAGDGDAGGDDRAYSGADGGDVVAVVNGVAIPASRISIYAQGEVSDEERRQIVENMITSELVVQAAAASGLRDDPGIRDQIAVAEQSILGRAYAERFIDGHDIGEEEQEKIYQEIVAEIGERKEYNVAHILVEDEAAANTLLEQIRAAPESFGDLARENSKDPGSAGAGGALGWTSPNSLVPEFAAAMQELEKGGLSAAPVKTDFGWHIIRVDDIRAAAAPPLDDAVRERIVQGRRAELFAEHLQKLREDAEVTIH